VYVTIDEYDIVAMAGAGGRGEWSTHEFQLLCCALGLDYDHRLFVLGLDACGAHSVVFCICINERL